LHPDRFIEQAFHLIPDAVIAAVRRRRAPLRNPPKTIEELLGNYLLQRLNATIALPRPHTNLL
jgi:hypothetical protein